ncbi:MAG TPA: S9 family peptidase [Myxococcales bacterium]|jgi:oligopeptidase B
MRPSNLAAVLVALLLAGCATTSSLTPPVAPRHPQVRELHGDKFVDDYFWLRQKGTPEVESYLKAERAYADAFMKPTAALRERLYREMVSRIQETDVDVPFRMKGAWYYSRTEKGKQYPVHCRKKGTLEAPEEILLDLNQLAQGKEFLSVPMQAVSPGGGLLAYLTDETGFRQYTLRIRDLGTGRDGAEAIPRVTSVAWFNDDKTLLYTVEDETSKRSYQAYRHTLGSAKDELVYEEKDEHFDLSVGRTRDDRMLLLESTSHTTSEESWLDADQPADSPKLILGREAGHEYYVDHREGVFYIRSNDAGCRNFRLVTAPVSDPSKASWKELVGCREDVMLEDVDMFRDFYVLLEREGGFPQLRVVSQASGESHRVEFPEKAYYAGPDTNREWDARLYRLNYQSPITPPSVYDYDVTTRQRTLLKQQPVLGGYDPARYEVELVWAPAKDGAQVPVWLLHQKGLVRDGTHPVLLYGYGAYGVPEDAAFSSNVFSLVDRGVIFASAFVRGGGELGKKWHDQGRMENKMNSFTDFIAAAEHLVGQGYTTKDRLAIYGGSAGGLLVAASTNLRPDLFKVVLAAVPFVDVINSMYDESLPLTVGEFEEWGNPKIPEQYRTMIPYSPYENLAARAYPTMLVESSYNDSQVMYWEPAKYVAKLRTLKTNQNPLVFNIKMEPAGHGGKSGRYDRLKERAYTWAFLLWQLGVEKL